MSDITSILSAYATGNTLRRKYNLLQERHRRLENEVWHHAHLPHHQAVQQFTRELLAAVHRDRPDAKLDSGIEHYNTVVTIKFPVAVTMIGKHPFTHTGELTVWLRGDQFHTGGSCNHFPPEKRRRSPRTLWFSARPDTRSSTMRKWPLTLRDTPASIWARARRYFVTEQPLLPPLPAPDSHPCPSVSIRG